MSAKHAPQKPALSPAEIDDLVTAQAEDDSAWGRAVEVKRTRAASFAIPPELAERAAFLARVHHAAGLQEWLTQVITERIELEEGAYAAVKRELEARGERRPPA
ncbi:MAG: hypothetical protein ACYDA8_11195 [Deferrisomatales bacterium]